MGKKKNKSEWGGTTSIGLSTSDKAAYFVFSPSPGWEVYADLDSTEIMKIWEVGCVPALYAARRGKGSLFCRECLLEAVALRLDYFRVDYRRYFEDREGHTCNES